MKINNTDVYGLWSSVFASGYPKNLTISGERDRDLYESHLIIAEKLFSTTPGSGHDCAAKGIIVQTDITAPQYFWLQWERYHFHDTISSQSTMHMITKMDLDEMCNEYVFKETKEHLKQLVKTYNFSKEGSLAKKMTFQEIISNIPEGLELTRRVTTNYLQLKTIYTQRKNHKLLEWREIFCPWVLELPFFQELMQRHDKGEENAKD